MDSPKSAAALLREHKSFMETTTNANLSDSENAEERKRKITKIESEVGGRAWAVLDGRSVGGEVVDGSRMWWKVTGCDGIECG